MGGCLKFLMKYGWEDFLLGRALMQIFDPDDLGEEKTEEAKTSERKRRVVLMMEDPLFIPMFMLFWIRTAGIRFFSHWLLTYSRTRTPFNDSFDDDPDYDHYPPIINLLNDTFSPIVVVIQFFGCLLVHSGDWVTILLLWKPDTFTDEEWLGIARRQFLAAQCEFHRRTSYRFSRWPWPIFLCVDDRMAWETRRGIMEMFVDHAKRKSCCLDPGWLRRMAALGKWTSVAILSSKVVRIVLWAVAWALALTTALAECTHARNRNLMHFLNNFAIFAAKCVHADVRSMVCPQNHFIKKVGNLIIGAGRPMSIKDTQKKKAMGHTINYLSNTNIFSLVVLHSIIFHVFNKSALNNAFLEWGLSSLRNFLKAF